MRRSLLKLNERHLPKALRQALVLITMLLLPSAAWGTVYTTSSYEASSSTIGTWNTDQASYSWYAAGSSEKSNDGGLKITIPTNSTLNTMLTLRKPDGSSTEYVTGIQINYSGDNKPTLHNLKVANIDIINQGESVTSQNPWTGNVSNGQFTFNSSIEWNAGQEIIIEYNDGVAYEESQKDFTITSIVVTTTESISYALWIGGTKFTSANLSSIASEKTDSVTSGSITFDPNNSVLTLNNATILSSITSGLSSLTIKLVGNNTVNSAASNGTSGDDYAIKSNNSNATLTIVRDEANADTELNLYGRYTHSIIGGFASVSYGEEGYQTYLSSPYMPAGYNTDSKQMIGYNTNGDYLTSASISSAVTYPIWVYNTSTQKYTQLTATASTYTTPEANVDNNHKGSVSYSADTLTLDNFFCKTTQNDVFVFYIGESLESLTVDLVGTNEIFYNCFKYFKPTDGENLQLTYTTSSSNGSLEFTGGPTYNNVDCAYKDGLGFYSTTISTDWPRLSVGGTLVRGTGSVNGYSNISYNDETKTLTLSGTTIGSQSSTATAILVYIKDLKVAISGSNTLYGRFDGEDSSAGTISFQNTDHINASLTITAKNLGPVEHFAQCTLGDGLKITEAKNYIDENNTVDVDVDGISYVDGNFKNGEDVPDYLKIAYQAPQLTVAGIEPGADGKFEGLTGVTYTPPTMSLDSQIPDTPATLTLDNATIAGDIRSTLTSLTIHLIGENTLTPSDGVAPFLFTEGSGSGSLTFESTEKEEGNLLVTNGNTYYKRTLSNLVRQDDVTDPVYVVSNTFDEYGNTGDWQLAFDTPNENDLQIYRNVKYNLWVTYDGIDYQYTKANRSSIVYGPNYDPENKALEFSYGAWNNPIKSSMEELNLKINNSSSLTNVSFTPIEGVQETGALNIIAESSEETAEMVFGSTTNTTPVISGFTAVNYDGFTILSDGAKYDTDKKQLVDAEGTAMTVAVFTTSVELEKPVFNSTSEDGEVSLLNDNLYTIGSGTESQEINYGTIKYSIEYADGSEGVTDEIFTEAFTISKPATVTACVTLNGEESANAIGKYFGASKEEYTVAIGDKIMGTSWFIPEIVTGEGGDNISCEFNIQENDNSGIFEREVTGSDSYLVAKKSGTTTINASLWSESITVLNSDLIALKFTVGEELSSVFEGNNNYGGLYNDSDTPYAVPEGMTAYVITGIDEETGSVKTSDPLDFIPAKTAVLLEKGTDAIAITHVPYTGTATAPTNNKLNYSDPNSPAKPSTTDNWYVLYNNKFVKVTTNTEVKGGKCYLNLNGTAAGTRGFYNIGNGEGTTAIREVKNGEVNSEKWGNGEWFDLQGRRLSAKPNKSGLYILNGKKIVIK